MKLFSRTIELAVLKSYTSSNKKITSIISQHIDDGMFYTAAGQEIYSRINTIATQRGILLGWDDLKEDIAISEDTRNYLKKYKKKPITSADSIKEKMKALGDYKKARNIYKIAEVIDKELINKESVDVDGLSETLANMFMDTTSNSDTSNWFMNIGSDDDSIFERELAKVVKTQKNQRIPTGIKAFDERNRGVNRGTFWNIVGPTGWGKSVMANMIGGSMARLGARVAIISLEMDHFENLQRQTSRVSDVEMNNLIDPDSRMDSIEKKRIIKVMKKWRMRIKKAGGLLSVVVPTKDLAIKDLLFILKPLKYDVVIIDYIGLLKGADGDDQVKALGRIGRFCKVFAGNNNMVIAACAQLNTDKGEIKYSGALKEHASLQWQWKVTEEVKETNIIEVEQTKARQMDPRPFYLKANFAKMRFEYVDGDYKPRESNEENGSVSKGRGGASSKKKTGFSSSKKSNVYDLEAA